MSSDRLAELQRQRALVRAHLDWLDQEIARTESASPPLASAKGGTDSAPTFPPALTSFPVEPPALAAYRPDPLAAAQRTQRGCFLAATALLLAGTLALVAIYVLRYRDRSLFELTTEEPATAPASPRK